MAHLDVLPDCKICHDIWRRLTDPKFKQKINFGSFKDVMSSKCSGHAPLAKAFVEHCLKIRWTRIRDSIDIGIRAGYEGEKASSVSLDETISKLGTFHHWSILLVHKDFIPEHPGLGRILNPDWVDISIAKRWKQECLTSHGLNCINPMKILPTRPAWVVDIENDCIVPGSECSDFVALSYRWGNTSHLMRERVSTAKLQESNALSTSEIAMQLPPIIRHAMYMTSAIGERYLWVDILCIDHSDKKSTAEQLELMAAIYASAIVTFIAADSDSQSGLLGLEGFSAPRGMEQRIFPFGNEEIVVRNTGMFDLQRGTSYYDRGWTYQESKMSQRKLFFRGKELHWQCQCSEWHEELIIGVECDKYLRSRLDVILAGFPDLDSLNHVIAQYNRRELTYEEDALPGISGLLSVTSRAFAGGFLYGLPEAFFDRCLGWCPYWTRIDLKRRTQSNRITVNQLSASALPSWSWIGWQGLVGNYNGEAIRTNDRQTFIDETIPITEWFTSDLSSDPLSRRRRIRSTWFENRDTFKDLTRPLPTGWTRHKAPPQSVEDKSRLYPDGCSEYIFKHCDMPENDREFYYYYPFPVTDIHESTPRFNPKQTAYIFCETKKTHLWAHQAGDNNILELRNEHCTKVGQLHLHNEQQRHLFPKSIASNTLGRPVDLVAIYRSRIYSKIWSKEQKKRYGHPIKIEEKYTILWVEEKDGVSYRLASGTVGREAWEELDLKDISLVLG